MADVSKKIMVVQKNTIRVIPPLLGNLLRDTSMPTLLFMAEQYGLKRIPGITHTGMINRLFNELSEEDLDDLRNALIAARYGSNSVDELVEIALRKADPVRGGKLGTPRLDDMPAAEALLMESSPGFWAFTMHGYDVVIQADRRILSCDCHYFRFAAHQKVLCKHLARALILIPATYARDILIDLLLWRHYGDPETPEWHFESSEAA